MTGYAAGMDDEAQYRLRQQQGILDWCAEAPPATTRTLSRHGGVASRALSALVPPAAFRAALDLVQSAAERLADQRSLLRRAGVVELAALREGSLRRCDQLAAGMRWRNALLGGGSGTLFGLAGGAGMALDIPTLLVLSFRTIQRVGLCYGEDCSDDRRLRVLIFSLASANSAEEKRATWETLCATALTDGGAWAEGLERTAERVLAKEALQASLKTLSRQFAERLGWRLSGGALPVVGAVVGGAVNAWFLSELATAAKHVFQWRWLQAQEQRAHLAALPQEF